MNNKISLKDWLYHAHRKEEYQDLFYGLHQECHRLYDSYDSGVPYLDIRNSSILGQVLSQIQLNWMNVRDVTYLGSTYIPLEQRDIAKQTNIDFLATFAMGVYLDYHYQNGLLNHEFIESNFDQCKQFLPEEDVSYYEDVFVNHQYVFYDEWQQHNIGTSQERGYQIVKGGRGYSMEEEKEQGNEATSMNAGFTQSAFLSITFFAVAITVMAVVFLVMR